MTGQIVYVVYRSEDTFAPDPQVFADRTAAVDYAKARAKSLNTQPGWLTTEETVASVVPTDDVAVAWYKYNSSFTVVRRTVR
jgi:hypothetical protein